MTSKWIWPFELLEKVGEGGMGVVYRARYVGNDKIVAVKLLPEDVAQNPTLVARFDRELEILTQLRHPNIVHCFGGTTESKQRFYAMELVEGGTLGDVLKKHGRLSWDHVVEYGIQICDALQYAHERGVIHRDLKPANFLLTKSKKIKLSDFGLATIIAGQRLTVAGRTAGTFLYMAPEQIRGQPPLSNRTDLYALGCVLHELLLGRPPYVGDAPAEVLHKHLKEPIPSVAEKMLDCPVALDKLITQLLQKNQEQRPASAAEVKLRLESVLRPSLSHVDPLALTPADPIARAVTSSVPDSDADLPAVKSTPQLSWPWPTAVVALLLLAIAGWWSAAAGGARARALEEMWVATALQPGPAQLVAMERLAHYEELSPAALDQLAKLVESTSSDEKARVAALVTIEQHPRQSGKFTARLISLQKNEQVSQVREQIDRTLLTIRNPKGGTTTRRSGWLWFGVLGLIGVGIGGWCWIAQPWKRWLQG
ncbi:MAG TPA: serine/threonine-protein kinase [Planctomycetaceae bacterium]|nr:serine/threonine-protein kinase [Planctomycetaceae bacterium]